MYDIITKYEESPESKLWRKTFSQALDSCCKLHLPHDADVAGNVANKAVEKYMEKFQRKSNASNKSEA